MEYVFNGPGYHFTWNAIRQRLLHRQGAIEFLDSTTGEQPFFLVVASTNPHGPAATFSLNTVPKYTPEGKVEASTPYHPPRENIAKRLKEQGLRVDHQTVSALFVDDQIAALQKKIKEIGQAENTVFLFVSDHKSEPGKATTYRYPKSVVDDMKNGIRQEAPNHLDLPNQGQPNITMQYYEGYFAADQLYDLQADPNEQFNLAYNPDYAPVLKDMKARLQRYLSTFSHPFNLEDTVFMESEAFNRLALKNVRESSSTATWLG